MSAPSFIRRKHSLRTPDPGDRDLIPACRCDARFVSEWRLQPLCGGPHEKRPKPPLRFPRLFLPSSGVPSLRIFGLTVFVSILTGCGTVPVRTLSPDYQTVFIEMADNSTLEYGAEERLTESLVREFQRDGHLKQVSEGQDADVVLDVNITGYDLDPVTLDNDNRAAGRNLEVSVTAAARSPKTGAWVMPEREFSDFGTFFLSNTPSGRREDDVYRRIAEKIISRMFEGWG
jgi:lipopolysaccharide assembly LptE-like protein